jgi:hypothetical protein
MKIPTWIVLPVVAVSMLSLPAGSPADPLQDCADQATDRADYTACLARRQRQAMRRLEEAREAAMAVAGSRGEEAVAALDAAEAAFDEFVEAGCVARTHLGGREVDAEDLGRDCAIRLIEEHADDLEAIVAEIGGE